ncbi:hypothetical protein Gotri_007590 [Gossypium trilobum]|uniref:Uncharacterized protein n=1 Tax=Gossypium trilobum TaxID=34281 RepID=A0A7J9EH35_9ROSI|nr:hypothetical protein [Gossypium trilobum]
MQEKTFLSGIVDGSTNLPVDISCFELIKPSFDETNQHCSLDMDVKIGLSRDPQIHEKTLTLPCYRQPEMNIWRTTLQKLAIEVEEPSKRCNVDITIRVMQSGFALPSSLSMFNALISDVLPILIEEASFPVREKSSLNTSHVSSFLSSAPVLFSSPVNLIHCLVFINHFFVQVSDAYSFSVLPEEGNVSPNCTRLTFLSLLEVPFSSKNQMCLDAQLSCQNCIDLKVDREDAYSPCFLDINIEKETPDIFKFSDETVGNLKSEGVVTHLQVLQRQASITVGEC